MRSAAPALLPIFRSRHQADLLTALFLHPELECTASELADKLDIPLTTAHRELQRLEEAGLLLSRRVGRARLLRANPEHRIFEPLAKLLLLTFGPHIVIAEEFAEFDAAIIIYGSWAARYEGVQGLGPADVDVLLVGSPPRAAVYTAAEHAEARLGMPVNPVIRSRARWQAGDDPLVATIRANPHLNVGAQSLSDAAGTVSA